MAASSAPLSPPPLSIIFKPKSLEAITTNSSFSPIFNPVFASAFTHSSRRRSHKLDLPNAVAPKSTTRWRLSASLGNYLLSEEIPDEISQEIVSTTDDGVSTVISVLLFIAFLGLSILTIGVIYIAVTDFLQKREREKFEKEESAKKKKNGKRGRVRGRARAGPKGFGQKIGEEDDYNDNDAIADD